MRECLGLLELVGCKIGKLVLNKLSVIMDKAGSLAIFETTEANSRNIPKYLNISRSVTILEISLRRAGRFLFGIEGREGISV